VNFRQPGNEPLRRHAMNSPDLPDIDENDRPFALVFDPTKSVFYCALAIKPNKTLTLPTKIARYPPCFQLIAEQTLANKIIEHSACVVSLFLEYYDIDSSTIVKIARVSGCAVGPRHVLTLAHFPDGKLPVNVVVVKDLYAPPNTKPDLSMDGNVITPPNYTDISPVLVELKQPFFETWLKPSNRPLQVDMSIFTVGYNAQLADTELTAHYNAMSTLEKPPLNALPCWQFLHACPPFKPTPALATDLLHPYMKSISPGNVLGGPIGGSVYVSSTVSQGSSGGPVFAYPIQEGCFDALVHGGKGSLNANIIIPTTHPTFLEAWTHLEKKLQ